jgi:farnesyl-diphosphate farnesyltransferase
MGNGMADYLHYKIETTKDYDVYCHYVAGLVGTGLSGLFAASGYENEALRNELRLANSMGLFLQKTNITRDYLEDYEAGRFFWPTEIWRKYQDELGDYAKNPNSTQSLAGLNAMVADATKHLTDCVLYLKMLRNEQVFSLLRHTSTHGHSYSSGLVQQYGGFQN